MAKHIKKNGAKINPKYRIGQKVWCRPWRINANGFRVFRGVIEEVGGPACGTSYYYTVSKIDNPKWKTFVRYEDEISLRKERLIREAKDSIENHYGGWVKSYKQLIKELDEL